MTKGLVIGSAIDLCVFWAIVKKIIDDFDEKYHPVFIDVFVDDFFIVVDKDKDV